MSDIDIEKWKKFIQEDEENYSIEAGGEFTAEACCCIGRQGDEPYCPCRMRREGIFKKDGKWIRPEAVIK